MDRKGKKFVIICGPDRAGKTTLINGLKEEFPNAVFYKGVRIQHRVDIRSYSRGFLDQVAATKLDYICDRFHWPDAVVYDHVVEDGDVANYIQFEKEIGDQLRELNAIVIYVHANVDTLVGRYNKLGEDPYMPRNKLELLLETYSDVLAFSKIPVFDIPTNVITPEQALELAKLVIDKYYGRI